MEQNPSPSASPLPDGKNNRLKPASLNPKDEIPIELDQNQTHERVQNLTNGNSSPDIFEELGLRNPPRFVDHDSPRPVDTDVLRAYHRGELDEEDAKDVDYLTSLFRDWHDASNQVLDEISLIEGQKVSNDLVLQTSLNKKPEGYWMSRKFVSVLTIAAGVLILVGGLGTYLMTRSFVVAQVQDGKKVVRLDSKGNVSGLPNLDEGLRSTVIQVLSGQNIQPLASLPIMPGIRSGIVLPLSKSLLLQPYRTVVSEQPTFHWEAIDDATFYTIRIYDAENGLIVTSGPVSATDWRSDVPLPRGVILTWDVLVESDLGSAIIPEKEPRPAFRILSDVDYLRYQGLKLQFSESHLVLGTFLLSEGLLDEALPHFEQLRQENPNSELPKRLILNLQSLRER